MTARDKYIIKLECPDCGHKGSANCSEDDGWSYMRGKAHRSIDELTDGIRWDGKTDYDKGQWDGVFVCKRCNTIMKQVGWGHWPADDAK